MILHGLSHPYKIPRKDKLSRRLLRSLSTYHPILWVKERLRDTMYNDDWQVADAVRDWDGKQDALCYRNDMMVSSYRQWNECIQVQVDYTEKLSNYFALRLLFRTWAEILSASPRIFGLKFLWHRMY